MGKEEAHSTVGPGFEVEITSGGREYDPANPGRPVTALSPARAAAKARARTRLLLIAAGVLFVGMALFAWAWLSNPSANIPGDVLARVNGEFIYEGDVAREIDLDRAISE